MPTNASERKGDKTVRTNCSTTKDILINSSVHLKSTKRLGPSFYVHNSVSLK
jgi:hypothetical protein